MKMLKRSMLLLAVLMVIPHVVHADVNSDVADLKTRVTALETKISDWEKKKEEMKKKREERRKQRGGKMGKGGYYPKKSQGKLAATTTDVLAIAEEDENGNGEIFIEEV